MTNAKRVASGNQDIDITFNNLLPLYNSRLLKSYSLLDDRVAKLGRLVKFWSKSRAVNEALEGTLSSYSHCLLLIHFLQRSGILPILQEKHHNEQEMLDENLFSWSLQSGQSADEFVKHFADICFDCLIRRQSTSASFSKDLWGMSICESQRHVNLPVFFGCNKKCLVHSLQACCSFSLFCFFLIGFPIYATFLFIVKGSKLKLSFVFFPNSFQGFTVSNFFQKKRHQNIPSWPPTHQPQPHPKDFWWDSRRLVFRSQRFGTREWRMDGVVYATSQRGDVARQRVGEIPLGGLQPWEVVWFHGDLL